MFLTLIGMSGTGKSYWSKKLETHGFKRFGCDDLITLQFAQRLGHSDTTDFNMHQWVGYPDEETYADRAQQYLQAEEDVLCEIIAYLNKAGQHENIVIDSTGSVIYMQPKILDAITHLTSMIYLDITPQDFDRMLKYYLENPVAIIWNGFFQPLPRESRQETFARCYPQLIKSRERKYKALAQVTIAASLHRNDNTSVEQFLGYLSGDHP
ncbi:MAG: hypothetical protein RBT01_08685 [Anaerolineaceae bacterium]|nr:hypothetical protein [Anaerolineaceae bacterium]